MCTLSWISNSQGYFVAFSRDERRSRVPATGPRILERAGVRAIAPIDGEAGGTWIMVNELGLTLALLNGYRFQLENSPGQAESTTWKSRGELPLEALEALNVAEVAERLARLDLARYRAFELAAFDAAGGLSLGSWTGSALVQRTLGSGDRPLVSSSFDDAGARNARRVEFARMVGPRRGADELERFHASHGPSRGPFSPCMHREDAHTVSFTRVLVSADQVQLSYQAQAPCAGRPTERVEIPRRVLARS